MARNAYQVEKRKKEIAKKKKMEEKRQQKLNRQKTIEKDISTTIEDNPNLTKPL